MRRAEDRLAARRSGGGSEPVVLLHGWSADSRVWTPLLATHGDAVAFQAPDLPGHGQTPLHASTPPDEFHAHVVARFGEWCEQMGLTRSAMIAWAWGARVLIDAIAQGRISPRSVMLVSIPPIEPVPSPFEGPLARDWPRYVRVIVRLMTARPVSPEMETWLTMIMSETSIAAAGAVHASGWTAPNRGFRLPQDSAAVFGSQDRIGSAESGSAMVKEWGVERLIVMDDVGHVPFIEARDEFGSLLFDWLGKIGVVP